MEVNLEAKKSVRRINLSRIAAVVAALFLFFGLLSYLLSFPRSTPEVAVTRFVETSVVTPEPLGTEWLLYTNTTPYYSFNYPLFWSRATSAPVGIENCGGPVFFTASTKSWMTVCAIDNPRGLSGIKELWLDKTKIDDMFIGGHLGMTFEYKELADRYEYYAYVENTSEVDLLQFHLITDVGEKDAVKVIFDRILRSLSFRQ